MIVDIGSGRRLSVQPIEIEYPAAIQGEFWPIYQVNGFDYITENDAAN